MKLFLAAGFSLLFFSFNGHLWAKEKGHSAATSPSEDNWDHSDVDQEVDNGMDDDKSDADTEKGGFKKDSDDSYSDNSMEDDGWLKSKFKEDADNDIDTETDQDDQKD